MGWIGCGCVPFVVSQLSGLNWRMSRLGRLEWRFGLLLIVAIVPVMLGMIWYEPRMEWKRRHIGVGLPKEKR